MFAYYGAKHRLARLYPEPDYDTIIEPFAGSAGYSLYGTRWRKQVYLYDIDPTIVEIWKYLIAATEEDILKLPILEPGEKLTDHPDLSEGARKFVGFMIGVASLTPRISATIWTTWTEQKRKDIAKNVHKVNHWQIDFCDYREVASRHREPVTWFVDPPYEDGGHKYVKSNALMDYDALADCIINQWRGQRIVSERSDAKWLELKAMQSHKGQYSRYTEGVVQFREAHPFAVAMRNQKSSS